MPHHNVMGIAKSALETSVKYLAEDLGRAKIRLMLYRLDQLKHWQHQVFQILDILKWNEYNSPLRRSTNIEEVGKNSIYLVSDLSSGVTGEIIHVDCGYHVVGMKAVDAPDITVD